MAEDPRILPFDLGQGEDAVLLIHGFSGSPYEMRYLGERLAAQGFRVKGVRLTGHGNDPFAFERATADDWFRDCLDALSSLSGARRAFVAGLSMGALLTVLLAAQRSQAVSGIALLAPAFRFRGLVRLFMWMSQSASVRRAIRFVPKGASAVMDTEERRRNPNPDRIPTLGATQLAELVVRAEKALPQVRAPALVAYSRLDPTVAPAAAHLAAERLGSRPVKMLELRKSLHLITIDRERDRVAEEVGTFFRGIAVAPGRATG